MKKLLVCVAALLGMSAFTQNSRGQERKAGDAGRITYVVGSSQKICQLTGEMDRELQRPTVNETGKRFGLVSADHGYSFEHNGKLFFLFGDTHPRPNFNGRPNGDEDPPRLADDNDAIAFTTGKTIGNCLRLDCIRDAIGAYRNPVVLNTQGQPAIKLRTNESPIAGISQGGKMFVIFGTDNPTDTARPPGPLGYPTRTVVAVSEDDAKTFHYLYDFSKGPDAKFIGTAIAQGKDGYMYFWGTQGGELYRRSAPYFARMRSEEIGKPDGGQSLEYFTGLGPDRMPRFSKSEADAPPLFQDYLNVSSKPQNCMGELGVEWNRFVKRWVNDLQLLEPYACKPSRDLYALRRATMGPVERAANHFQPHEGCRILPLHPSRREPRKSCLRRRGWPEPSTSAGWRLRAVLHLSLHHRRRGSRDFHFLLHHGHLEPIHPSHHEGHDPDCALADRTRNRSALFQSPPGCSEFRASSSGSYRRCHFLMLWRLGPRWTPQL